MEKINKILIAFVFIILSSNVYAVAQSSSCSAIPTICMYSRNVSLVSVNSSNYWGTYLYSDYANLGSVLIGSYGPYLSTYNASYDKPHYLYDASDQIVVDGEYSKLFDDTGLLTIDWKNRNLHNISEEQMFNWETYPIFTTNTEVQGQLNVTGNLYTNGILVNQWLYNQTTFALNNQNWNVSGTSLFPKSLAYRVGIGTTSTTSVLTVSTDLASPIATFTNTNSSSGVSDGRGSILIKGNSNDTGVNLYSTLRSGGGITIQNNNGSNNSYGAIGFMDAGANYIASIGGIYKSDVDNLGELSFATRNGASGLLQALRITEKQDVIIGTNTETGYTNRLVISENLNAQLRLTGSTETDGAGLFIGAIPEGSNNNNEIWISSGVDYNASSGGILNLTARVTSGTWIHADNSDWKLFANATMADNSIFQYSDNLPVIWAGQASTGLKVAIAMNALPNIGGLPFMVNGSIWTYKDDDGIFMGGNRDFKTFANGTGYFIDRQAGSGNIIIPDTLRLGIGTTPDAPFHLYSTRYGPPNTTGSIESNSLTRLQAYSSAIDIGLLTDGTAWLQPRSTTNMSTNYNLLLNPNGGRVSIGNPSSSIPALLSLNSSSVIPIIDAEGGVSGVDIARFRRVSAVYSQVAIGGNSGNAEIKFTPSNFVNWTMGAVAGNGQFRIAKNTTLGNSNDVFTIDDATEYVGIGTITPSQKLAVMGSGALQGIAIGRTGGLNEADSSALDLLEFGGTGTETAFGTTQAYGFRLKLDGSTNTFLIQSGAESTVNSRFAITRDTGNVGIGTSTPSQKLQVIGMMMLNATTETSCSGSVAGSIYYNSTTNKHYGCNSTTWNALY
jgi:hypothetical protein